MAISWLLPGQQTPFPPLEQATEHGLLAAGGDLSPARLITAYQRGIFPWFNRKDPILWWSPDPRMVLYPNKLHISKSLNKLLRKNPFNITFDTAFSAVITACAAPRQNLPSAKAHDTWIHDDMIVAYEKLFELGYAHSVECWQEDKLVGGLYGVALGKVFFGESMFSFATDSSKIALVGLSQQLQRWGFEMIDCQVHSDHLTRLGAINLPRNTFLKQLKSYSDTNTVLGHWQLDPDLPHFL